MKATVTRLKRHCEKAELSMTECRRRPQCFLKVHSKSKRVLCKQCRDSLKLLRERSKGYDNMWLNDCAEEALNRRRQGRPRP